MAYIGVSPSNGVRRKHTYTATAAQTDFTGAGAEGITLRYLDSNYIDVYQNGVKLSEADYTSTSGDTIVLAETTVSDIIEIVVYDVFSVADTVSKSAGGTFDGDVTLTNIAGGAVFNEGSADVDLRVETNGNANMLFVDGGDDAVVIGHNASRKTLFNTTATAALQIEGTSGNTAAMSIARNSNDDNGPQLVLAKSNGTAGAAVTVVTDDALLGRISWQGADGTQTVEAARIEGFVDGTPGANDMPGRLTFSTTADGAATVTERVRIHTNGVASFNNGIALGVGTASTSTNVLDDYEEGVFSPAVAGTGGGGFALNSDSDTLSYTKIGRQVTITGRLDIASTSSPSGDVKITGLPFVIGDLGDNAGDFSGLINFLDSSASSQTNIVTRAFDTETQINLKQATSAVAQNDSYYMSFSYFTTA